MKKPDTTIIDQDWPAEELEEVHNCPYCGSEERTIAYENVQDWSFYCAPGKWTYWDCAECEALYLNPRPTEASIGKAYASYYTHSNDASSIIQQLKTRLKNELFYHSINANLSPRFHVPKWLGFIVKPLKKLIHIPFELEPLVNLPKGMLLDVGCGSGTKLKNAKQLGWQVTGLEVDPNAVKVAIDSGLNVVHGDYRKLAEFNGIFDCVICIHVLEHVHEPLELLSLLHKTLKPNGVLLLSLPNSRSHVRFDYGSYWRGLEAPRHLSIPTLSYIVENYTKLINIQLKNIDSYGLTATESKKIKLINYNKPQHSLKSLVKSLDIENKNESDLIQIIMKLS